MLTSDDIGKIVSFNLYPSGILPNPITRAKVLDIFSPATALKFADVASLHANVYPTLPVGSPTRYKDYNYVQVQLENGSTLILGLPWIVNSSIVIHLNVQVQVIVSDVNASDVPAIRAALVANGFSHLAIELL